MITSSLLYNFSLDFYLTSKALDVNTIKCEQKCFSHFTHNSVMFSVLLHGSDQKVWQSLLVKSLQKKSNKQEKLNLYNDSDKQHAVKSAFFAAAANATTSEEGGGGGGGND